MLDLVLGRGPAFYTMVARKVFSVAKESNTPVLSDVDAMEQVTSWSDAIATIQSQGIEVTVVDEFTLVEKDVLVGKPFVVLSYSFSAGSYSKSFVSVRVMTEQNEKLVFNDGSTGVRDQLQRLADKGIQTGILCSHGLRVSEFFYNEDTKETSNVPKDGFKPASTFYLS